jgi:hypothetical protein
MCGHDRDYGFGVDPLTFALDHAGSLRRCDHPDSARCALFATGLPLPTFWVATLTAG